MPASASEAPSWDPSRNLIFAKTGILHHADEGLAQPTNDFERIKSREQSLEKLEVSATLSTALMPS
jgi:hypothetical protein